jgi:SAM-dependent methyltransferase
MALYGQDLAYIQAAAFGGLARGAAPEIVRLLQSAAIPIRSVVDAGCGAGVLAVALVEAGFSVTGIDNSAELLMVARAGAPQARFATGSIYEVEIPCCQAIIAVGEPLTYHAEGAEADRLVQSFFERASAILPSGGVLIFDVIETGEPSLSGRFWSSGEDWAVLSETSEDQAARTLVRTIETFRRVGNLYRRGLEIHHVCLFETRELSSQLAGFGFAVRTAQAYGSYPLAPRRRAFFCRRQ